jgi:cysteine desulfurase
MKPGYRKMGNPSSIYSIARVPQAIEAARSDIAAAIGADPEKYTLPRGTESETGQLVLGQGFLKKGKHFITSPIEHHAVSETMES